MKREKLPERWPDFVNDRPAEEFVGMDERTRAVTNSRDKMAWQLNLVFVKVIQLHNLVVEYQEEQDRIRQNAEFERGKRWTTAGKLGAFLGVSAMQVAVSLLVYVLTKP